MKRNLVNFTRGSQLLGHFGFMFAAGLKGPLLIALVVTSWTTWWWLSSGLSDHETYLPWMRVYAAGYTFMEFDPHKLVRLETGFGGTLELPMSMVDKFPPVTRAWQHMLTLLWSALAYAGAALVPAFIAFYWFAARFGKRSKERQHERGALLVALPELIAEIHAHNHQERRRELSSAMGWRWRLLTARERDAALPYRPSQLAGIAYPWKLEQSHAMLVGTTGMGKTVAMSDMVAQARARGQQAVIFDLTGAYIEHFYDSRRDVILNPLDARCPAWSLFDECRTEGELWSAAEALVPHDGGGEAQFWVIAARALFVEFCLKLIAQGQASNEALADQLMTADLSQVHAMMRGTIADPLTAPEAARMAESIRAVFNVNAKALKLLPRTGTRFSMRDWVEGSDGNDGSIVFVSSRYVDMSVCSQLLTLWLDTAMNTLMAMDRSRSLRLWFFVDELGALHRLPALEKGLQTARNYGGAIVTGIHAYAKLKEVYGENMAMTLSSLARTKLILGTADRETATWCSDFIGHRQVRDMEEGYTYGFNNARDAVSLTPRKHIEPLLLPDQLMNLPRLSGYIKFPDGFPAAPIKLKPVSRPKRAEPFIARGRERPPATAQTAPMARREDPPSADEEAPHPSSNDDGAGKPAVPKQGELVLGSRASARARKLAEQPTIDGLQSDQNGLRSVASTRREGPSDRAAEAAFAGEAKPQSATLPKSVVLAPGNADMPRKDGEETPESTRADAPKIGPPDVQKANLDRPQSVAERSAERRLLIEDGVPEQEPQSHPGPDLGDVDMEL